MGMALDGDAYLLAIPSTAPSTTGFPTRQSSREPLILSSPCSNVSHPFSQEDGSHHHHHHQGALSRYCDSNNRLIHVSNPSYSPTKEYSYSDRPQQAVQYSSIVAGPDEEDTASQYLHDHQVFLTLFVIIYKKKIID